MSGLSVLFQTPMCWDPLFQNLFPLRLRVLLVDGSRLLPLLKGTTLPEVTALPGRPYPRNNQCGCHKRWVPSLKPRTALQALPASEFLVQLREASTETVEKLSFSPHPVLLPSFPFPSLGVHPECALRSISCTPISVLDSASPELTGSTWWSSVDL